MDPSADLSGHFLQLACGNWVTQMLHVAAELAIADHLAAAGPEGLTAEDLAGRCGADGESLFRLLRGLASLGVFAESESQPRHFVLTPLAELLRSDHPGSLRQFVRMLGGEHYDAWTDQLHSVRSGRSAFRHHFGEAVFDWYGHNPERGAIFDGAMTDFSRVEPRAAGNAPPRPTPNCWSAPACGWRRSTRPRHRWRWWRRWRPERGPGVTPAARSPGRWPRRWDRRRRSWSSPRPARGRGGCRAAAPAPS